VRFVLVVDELDELEYKSYRFASCHKVQQLAYIGAFR